MSPEETWDVRPTHASLQQPQEDAATEGGQPVPYHGAEISDADTQGNQAAPGGINRI